MASTEDRGIIEDLQRIGRLLGRRGLVVADDGNLSARTGDGTIWITASGTRTDDLAPDDLVRIDLEGQVVEGTGRPSSEYRLHLEIYRRREEIGAIVHAHPPVATGFAVAGEPIQDTALAEAAYSLGAVPVVPYRRPGTGDVAEAVVPMLDLCWAFLLANHGAVAMGRDPEDACRRMERLEHVASTILTARLLGGARSLDS